jgi:hypothetical protein
LCTKSKYDYDRWLEVLGRLISLNTQETLARPESSKEIDTMYAQLLVELAIPESQHLVSISEIARGVKQQLFH